MPQRFSGPAITAKKGGSRSCDRPDCTLTAAEASSGRPAETISARENRRPSSASNNRKPRRATGLSGIGVGSGETVSRAIPSARRSATQLDGEGRLPVGGLIVFCGFEVVANPESTGRPGASKVAPDDAACVEAMERHSISGRVSARTISTVTALSGMVCVNRTACSGDVAWRGAAAGRSWVRCVDPGSGIVQPSILQGWEFTV